MPDRLGDWMCTFTGRQFWPRDPRAEDVCIEDVAHHLAQENRFNGALPEPYSVAQHCVMVSHLVEIVLHGSVEEQKQALLHDAPEAYLKDLHRPLKLAIREIYDPLEDAVWKVIAEKFGVAEELPPIIKEADNLCLAMERRDLFPASHQQLWKPLRTVPRDLYLGFIDWRDAKRSFLRRFRELFGGADV